mgnify:CR=1 FL=1
MLLEYVVPCVVASIPSLLICILDITYGLGVGVVLFLIIHFLIGSATLMPYIKNEGANDNFFKPVWGDKNK